ncbi:sensor histidine kinase [Nonomuraea sp. NPDC050556]|uniref:sensor histidine kinase n=1 Tax=Nonomuraea sp. NPDC050556 TaxID=3364369 RepID=UPI00379AAC62
MMRNAFEALDRLAGGVGTAMLALLTLTCWLVTLALCGLGVGFLILPKMLALTRMVTDRERTRLSRWGAPVLTPSATTGRDLSWIALHGTAGLVLSIVGVALPINAVRDLSLPLWWRLLPEGESSSAIGIPALTWPAVWLVSLSSVLWLVLAVLVGPRLAQLVDWYGRRLLSPHPSEDLTERVAKLTATRAGALRAHAAELRRIERSLHDGAQNRLVAVVVMVAAAKRALARDPATSAIALERAQGAAEQALAELRAVVRGILPPVLENKGLAGALSALAAECGVPCGLEVGELGTLPLSVETTAYFTVAEALTNISKHSGARRATVQVSLNGQQLRIQVRDDGKGGAQEHDGSGLAGIRRRVESHDGAFTLTSPDGGPTTIEVELPCA